MKTALRYIMDGKKLHKMWDDDIIPIVGDNIDLNGIRFICYSRVFSNGYLILDLERNPLIDSEYILYGIGFK